MASTIEYEFEQLELEESGVVEASGYAEIAYDSDEWWVLAIYSKKEVGAVPSKAKAVYDEAGDFSHYEEILPRIPGVIVITDLDKDSRLYGEVRDALNKRDSDIWAEIEAEGDLPARRGNEHSTLNHAQQGIGR
jgi:hypothetical protein